MSTQNITQQCCGRVFKGTDGFRSRYNQCTRAGKVMRDGKWYCSQHDPEAVKARREKASEAFAAHIAENGRLARLQASAPDMAHRLAEIERIAGHALEEMQGRLADDEHRRAFRALTNILSLATGATL